MVKGWLRKRMPVALKRDKSGIVDGPGHAVLRRTRQGEKSDCE